MSAAWNNWITFGTIGIVVLLLLGQQSPKQQKAEVVSPWAQRHETTTATKAPSPPVKRAPTPRLLKFKLTLSSPQDLKVKQGDTVVVGTVLAERVKDRLRLTRQRQILELSLQQIQSRSTITPAPPKHIPSVKNLPPISYVEEQTAIQAAAINVQQAERALQLQQELKTEPLEASAAVQRAAVEVQNRQRILDNQQRKIDAVAILKDLPPSVAVHEQEVWKQRFAELKQATADYQQALAKLTVASRAQTEKLTSLAAAVERTKAEYQLMIAKLQTKKDQRAYTEYEASLSNARFAENKNQADQNYSHQLQEAQQSNRDRSFQLAQVQAKIAEVDEQLAALAIVTSPYSGVIRRVKIGEQTNNSLAVDLTLVVNHSRT